MNMRNLVIVAATMTLFGTAGALTPLPDESLDFFAGEWAGAGEQGAYCYLNLDARGRGWVLIDAGAGDWLGARIHWNNKHQALLIEKITPLRTSTELRIMPLDGFSLANGFNQSLRLAWERHSSGCQLQKVAASADHLAQARSTLKRLRRSNDAR